MQRFAQQQDPQLMQLLEAYQVADSPQARHAAFQALIQHRVEDMPQLREMWNTAAYEKMQIDDKLREQVFAFFGVSL
jgi:hypothetical protein